jgi:hypothetical protein
MPTSKLRFSALLLVLCTSSAACSVFGSDGDETSPSPSPDVPGQTTDGGAPEPPKATPVGSTPDTSEINETFGIFVAPRGTATGDGSREHPLDTIQAGIERGKLAGKRVYVCSGTYREALVLADSISIIGGADCSGPTWKLGNAKSRIESPTSPAVVAKGLVSPTRLEGLDIVAPNAAEPSASSIGLQAVRAPALVIAGSKITAGDGANGTDGAEGIQLVQQGTLNGSSLPAATCVNNVTCKSYGIPTMWAALTPPGGTSVCAGAPGHDGLPGGFGGAGAVQRATEAGPAVWQLQVVAIRGEVKSGAAGVAGVDAPNGPLVGTLSDEGYGPAGGVGGTDGSPGIGGGGGYGSDVHGLPGNFVQIGSIWRATSGASGGAGGCPGLAGAAGSGGGASIALALVESPVVVEGTELVAGRGGAGGRGTFGSDPTPGGLPGASWTADPPFTGRSGGGGGLPGVSTNGSSGPSLGVLHTGAAPKLAADTKVVPGAGGAAVDSRSRDALGTTRTIPATPAGLSAQVHAL